MDCIKYLKPLGYLAIIVSVTAWAMDINGLVAKCPYCQLQRTIIGVLGLLMIMPQVFSTCVLRYITLIIGAYGAHVAATQSFANLRLLIKGELGNGYLFLILSTLAFIFIMTQILLLWRYEKNND